MKENNIIHNKEKTLHEKIGGIEKKGTKFLNKDSHNKIDGSNIITEKNNKKLLVFQKLLETYNIRLLFIK